MEDFLNEIPAEKQANTANKRVAAAVIDYFLFILFFFFYIFTFGEKDNKDIYHITGGLAWVPVIFWLAYFVLGEFAFSGTIGKKIMRLKVVSLSGTRLSLFQILKRRFCDLLDIWWCLGIVGLILIKTNANSQRLGDILAKTTVIHSY